MNEELLQELSEILKEDYDFQAESDGELLNIATCLTGLFEALND